MISKSAPIKSDCIFERYLDKSQEGANVLNAGPQ